MPRVFNSPFVAVGLWSVLWAIALWSGAVWAWAGVNMGLIHLTRLVMALPHELGHVVAARLVGWRASGVVLGETDEGLVLGPSAFTVTIDRLDGSGFAKIWPGTRRAHRARDFVMHCGGAAAHAVAFAAAWLAFGTPPVTGLFEGPAWLLTFLVGNAVSFLAAVWPRALGEDDGNDAWRLLRIMRRSPEEDLDDWAESRLAYAAHLDDAGQDEEVRAILVELVDDVAIDPDIREEARAYLAELASPQRVLPSV